MDNSEDRKICTMCMGWRNIPSTDSNLLNLIQLFCRQTDMDPCRYTLNPRNIPVCGDCIKKLISLENCHAKMTGIVGDLLVQVQCAGFAFPVESDKDMTNHPHPNPVFFKECVRVAREKARILLGVPQDPATLPNDEFFNSDDIVGFENEGGANGSVPLPGFAEAFFSVQTADTRDTMDVDETISASNRAKINNVIVPFANLAADLKRNPEVSPVSLDDIKSNDDEMRKTNLQDQHIQRTHSHSLNRQSLKIRSDVMLQKTLKCEICGQLFARPCNLACHKRKHNTPQKSSLLSLTQVEYKQDDDPASIQLQIATLQEKYKQ